VLPPCEGRVMVRVVAPLLVAWVNARVVGPRCESHVPRLCPLGSLSQPVCIRVVV
jgi:hypothetical protein